jgi:hypothetical protein
VETVGRDVSSVAAFVGEDGAIPRLLRGSGVGHAWVLVVDMAFRRWTRSSWCRSAGASTGDEERFAAVMAASLGYT